MANMNIWVLEIRASITRLKATFALKFYFCDIHNAIANEGRKRSSRTIIGFWLHVESTYPKQIHPFSKTYLLSTITKANWPTINAPKIRESSKLRAEANLTKFMEIMNIGVLFRNKAFFTRWKVIFAITSHFCDMCNAISYRKEQDDRIQIQHLVF